MSLTFELRYLRNLTSGSTIFVFAEGECVEAVEFTEKNLVFILPNAAAFSGNLVSLDCRIHYPEKHIDFAITGKILSKETLAPGEYMRLGIEIRQYDKEIWTQFLQKSQDAQRRVDRVLTTMKGEDYE